MLACSELYGLNGGDVKTRSLIAICLALMLSGTVQAQVSTPPFTHLPGAPTTCPPASGIIVDSGPTAYLGKSDGTCFSIAGGGGGTGTVTSVGNVNLANFSNCTVSNPTTTPTWSCAVVAHIDLTGATDILLPTILAPVTLTTPTIASFVNATHSHQNNAGGGTLSAAAIASGTFTLAGSLFANNGTTTTVLHGNAAGNPSFAAVSLVNDVTGNLGTANGGLGANNSASNGVPVFATGVVTMTTAGMTIDGQTCTLGSTCTVGTNGTASTGNTTAVTVNANTTGDQILQELHPANGAFNSGNIAFVLHQSGIYTTAAISTPTITLKAKMCSQTGGGGTCITLFTNTTIATVSATNNQFVLDGSCGTKTTGATGNLICHAGVPVDLTAASVTATVFTDANTTNSGNYDLTGANFIIFTIAFSAGSASNAATGQLAYVSPLGMGGTVTSVASGAGLSGGPITATGTLTTDNTVVCQPGSFATQTDGATVTWAIASAMCANAALTFTVHSGSRTLNITNPTNGGSYVLWIKQDGTGGEGLTLGTGCTWKVSGGGAGAVTPSTGASAIDVLAFTYDGTNCYANFNKTFN